MSPGGGGRPSGRGGRTEGTSLLEDRPRACVLLEGLRRAVGFACSACCGACVSANGEGEGGVEGGSVGVGVTGASVGECGRVRSEGCTNGFSDVPEPDAVPVSKLVLRSNREGLGECTTTSPDERVGSMSSRGTAYPSRAMSTDSCDLKARVPPRPAEAPVEVVRPERIRLVVWVTLERREGPEVCCANSRADLRRCRSASSQRLRVCTSPKKEKEKKIVSALVERGHRTVTQM